MTTITAPAPSVHQSQTSDPWGQRLSTAALVAMPVVTIAVLTMLPKDAESRASDTDTARKVLSAAAEHRTGVWISGFLLAGLFLLLIPALQTVLQAVQGRGRALVRTGYVLACVGACAIAMVDLVPLVALRAATAPGLDSGAMVDFTVALQKDHGPLSPLYWLILPLMVGLVVMTVGVARSAELRWWHAVLLPVSVLSLVFAGADGSGYVAAALIAAFAAAMVTRHPAQP